MKKHIIAGAVAAAVAVPAMAQNVTLSGRVGATLDSYASQTAAGVTTTQQSIGDPNSRLIATITEDLGGGLKFVGQLDIRGASDSPSQNGAAVTSSPVANFNGNTYASISGNFGRILVGKHDMLYNETLGNSTSSDVLDGVNNHRRLLFVSTRAAVAAAAPTQITGGRVNNLLRYDTPQIGSFNATVGYSTNPAADEVQSNAAGSADDDKGSAQMAFLRYSEGPLKATFGYYSEKRDVAAAAKPSDRFMLAAAAYNFGQLEIGVNYTQNDHNTGAGAKFEHSAWQVPVNYTMGATTFHGSYARVGETSNQTGSGANQYMLGVTYNLSKRTLLGAGYSKLENGTNARFQMLGSVASDTSVVANGGDAEYYGVGIRHNF
jgi:predicted porin